MEQSIRCLGTSQEHFEIYTVVLVNNRNINLLSGSIDFQIIYRWNLHHYECICMKHEKHSEKPSGINSQYAVGNPVASVQIYEV